MPTTFDVDNFLNPIVDCIVGSTAISSVPCYTVDFYSGSQPANPSTTPSGSQLTSSASLLLNGNYSAAASGVCKLSTSVSANAASTGTIGFARISTDGNIASIDTTVGVAGSGAGCILSSLSATKDSPITVTNLDVKMPYTNGGTLQLNSDVVNHLVSMVAGIDGTAMQMGINGSILVYSGSAPANADMSATGTLLATIPTGSNSPWGAASGGASSLTTNISSNASASGTAGYIRWVKGNYTIQGSVGTSNADFILDNLTITSGHAVTLTEATITLS
jgi:hypothetical protein